MSDESSASTGSKTMELDSHTRHELRTPLNHIIGYTEMLAEDAEDAGNEEQLADLRRIRDAAHTLLRRLDAVFGGRMKRVTGSMSAVPSRPPEHSARKAERVIDEALLGNLLVVDDNEVNRDVLGRLLKRAGHRVVEAVNGLDALERLAGEAFDLVLLDVQMPEMDGYETLQRIKAADATKHIPVVMISATHELEAVVRAVDDGAEDYLPKPFEPVLLHARVGACLEKKRLRDQEQAQLKRIEEANRKLQETQAQLVQAEKIASLGLLVAGVAHEINTPLGAMRSMLDTLTAAVGKLRSTVEQHLPAEVRENRKMARTWSVVEDTAAMIGEAAERLSDTVGSLRRFARLDEAALKEADINQGVEDTLAFVRSQLKPGVVLTTSLSEIPLIVCYPRRINQAVLNLVKNAAQSIEESGSIEVATRATDDTIEISVTDTGCGMSEEVRAHMFDPGFTTKGVGVGTGLGLPTCYQIVRDHKGSIDVESTEGRGTSVTISLPRELGSLLPAS